MELVQVMSIFYDKNMWYNAVNRGDADNLKQKYVMQWSK